MKSPVSWAYRPLNAEELKEERLDREEAKRRTFPEAVSDEEEEAEPKIQDGLRIDRTRTWVGTGRGQDA